MAFDAGMLRCLADELNRIDNSKVVKIFQPMQDEIILNLYLHGKDYKLLINAGCNYPRINITKKSTENPIKAPSFCMLLRKHLTGSVFCSAKCVDFERVCELEFDSFDEMGFKSKKYLVCEIMGKYSNIVLTDKNKKIIGVLKPVDFTTSSKRQILCGMMYEYPPKQNKQNTYNVSTSVFEGLFDCSPSTMKCEKFITANFTGLSLQTARQIAYSLTKNIDSQLSDVKLSTLVDTFFSIREKIILGECKPYMVLNDKGEPIEFSYIPLQYFGNNYKNVKSDSFSEMIDEYFDKKSTIERIKQKSQDITQIISSTESRLLKKINLQKEELSETDKAEEYKKKADLITANFYSIKKGAYSVRVIDYFDESMPELIISLDSRLSPSANAQFYYKKYNKLKKAKTEIANQIEKSEKELNYIYSVSDSLSRVDSEVELQQIREELFHSGYASKMKNYSSVKKIQIHPLKLITSGGYTLYCGKNNMQNDHVTTKLGEKNDWWFHVKNMPGSHVLLQTDNKEPSEKDFTEAAEVAAYYSKAEGNNIAVDYTKIRNVKKPAGAKPGFVTYSSNWTAYVTPDEKKVKEMICKQ